MIIPLAEAAEKYGIKRKSIRQAARRHPLVNSALITTEEGVQLDTDVFDLWWNEYRDAHMDAVRQGRS